MGSLIGDKNLSQSIIVNFSFSACAFRPVAIKGEVVIRPMMYVALTYDHRIVDGREAVTFLRTIKDCIEDPTRLLLGL